MNCLIFQLWTLNLWREHLIEFGGIVYEFVISPPIKMNIKGARLLNVCSSNSVRLLKDLSTIIWNRIPSKKVSKMFKFSIVIGFFLIAGCVYGRTNLEVRIVSSNTFTNFFWKNSSLHMCTQFSSLAHIHWEVFHNRKCISFFFFQGNRRRLFKKIWNRYHHLWIEITI